MRTSETDGGRGAQSNQPRAAGPQAVAPSGAAGGRSRSTALTRKQRQVLTAIQKFSTLNGYMPSVRELGRELGGLAPATVQHHLISLREKGFLDHDGSAHGLRLAALPGGKHAAAELSAAGESRRAAGGPTSGAVPGPGAGGMTAEVDEILLGGNDGRGGGSSGGGQGPTWGLELPGMQVVVPLLGTIAAGRPLEAVEESEEFVPIPASLARGSTFALRVSGSSMVDDAILDRDLVIVQACERVENGTVAVALLPDGTATLKRVHVEKDPSGPPGATRVRLQPANKAMDPLLVDSVRIRGRVVGLIRKFE